MSHICSRNTLIKSTTTKNAGELKNVSRFHYIKHIIIVSFTLFPAGPSQHIQNLIISPIEMLRNIQIANFGPFYRSVIQRSPKRLNNISSMYCQTPTQLTLFPPVTRKTTSTKIKRPSVLIISLHGQVELSYQGFITVSMPPFRITTLNFSATIMTTNCASMSGREVLLAELSKLMPVDVFGPCGLPPPKNDYEKGSEGKFLNLKMPHKYRSPSLCRYSQAAGQNLSILLFI